MSNELLPDIQEFERVITAAIGMTVQADREQQRVDLVDANGDVACSIFWDNLSPPSEQAAAMLGLESVLHQLCSQRDALKAENTTLRQVLCASAKAVDASLSPDSSIEFMALLPAEIHLVIARLKSCAARSPDRLEAGQLALAAHIGPICTKVVAAAIGKEVSNDQSR